MKIKHIIATILTLFILAGCGGGSNLPTTDSELIKIGKEADIT